MARAAAADKQFLEQHNGGKWRVTIAVPRELHAKLGSRLKRPLRTDSLAVANAMKWQIVAELRATIEQARGMDSERDAVIAEALEIARLRQRAQTHEEIDSLNDAVVDRAYQLRGGPVGEGIDPFHWRP